MTAVGELHLDMDLGATHYSAHGATAQVFVNSSGYSNLLLPSNARVAHKRCEED